LNGSSAAEERAMSSDPAYLWPGYQPRSASFENPTAAPSAGGTVAGGRKGSPSKLLAPGERVVLADIAGPGRITRFWLTVGRARRPGRIDKPAVLRAQSLEVFYDDLAQPSVSVPLGDYFGAVHGVPVAFASALTAVNEGRGYVSRIPLPFRQRVRLEYENGADEPVLLYYQIDALLGPEPEDRGYLHAAFRRENPTTLARDFVVWEGLRGPGRFLGWTGGVRVFDQARWWGEGEVKFYLDGETTPTICGTGMEDYLESAWGLGTFSAPESGAPLVWSQAGPTDDLRHDWVSFYRWHLADPVVFARELRVTAQQIGMASFQSGQEEEFAAFRATQQPAGLGWQTGVRPPLLGLGLYERADDWCGTAFVYLNEPQPVPRYDRAAARRDLPPPSAALHSVVRS
jgi:hypothetical protein